METNQEAVEEKPSLIMQVFGKNMIKKIFYHCCRIDIPDNNDKATMLSELIGPNFVEVGTGTNRMAFKYIPDIYDETLFKGGSNLIFEIALDRRGLIDNFTEFKRSIENPEFIVKCYETNLLVLVQEYVTVMDEDEFKTNEVQIKTMLRELSDDFIFEDIGFTTKNHTNYGYRANGDIVILDAGYIYPFGPNREKILTCPKCHNRISYNRDYTGFVCRECRTRFSFIDIRRSTMALNKDVEDIENQMISKLNKIEMPDFASFDTRMFNKGL